MKTPYSLSWSKCRATRPPMRHDVRMYALVALVALGLGYSVKTSIAQDIAPMIEDLSYEECELNGNRGDIIPPWWYRCTDVEGNVAFREPVMLAQADRAHDEYMATLAVEAPETLLPPVRSEFVDDASFNAARARFTELGHWATEDIK